LAIVEKLKDTEAMRLAIAEARRGEGRTSPNPLVGCVIVAADGSLLAKGFHAQAGRDHAEIDALKKVTDPARLKEARVYVTLEPCAHYGRTPPCAEALAKTGVSEIIYGLGDPNPQVAGRGLEILRQAGKQVRALGELTAELEELAEVFLYNMRHRRSFVALKVATSLDGKLAMADGESKWITHEPARDRNQELRHKYDAVVVGVQTLLHDDPRLTARVPDPVAGKAAVILDPNGRSLAGMATRKVLAGRDKSRVFVVVRQSAQMPNPAGVELVSCPLTVGGRYLDLPALTAELYRRGLCSLYVEGGAQTLSQFLQQGAFERLYQFISPVVLGDRSAITWTKDFEVATLSARLELASVRWETVGPDVLVTGRRSSTA
jgi:diaminohydroxyphosphoribosylaminopyrimidine deaminase/5-amino-6-(5-phosphoribosylamino)uracil reductase